MTVNTKIGRPLSIIISGLLDSGVTPVDSGTVAGYSGREKGVKISNRIDVLEGHSLRDIRFVLSVSLYF